MKRFFKCITVLLILSVIGLHCPRVSFCMESGLFDKADEKIITLHEPKIMSEPEKMIPVSANKTAKRKKTTWLLMGLGAAALVCLAVIAAPSDDPGPGVEKADVNVSW